MIEYLNIKPSDVEIESIRLRIDKNTFENGKTPVKLSAQNIKDINAGKSHITLKLTQGQKAEDIKHGGALPLLALIPAAAALIGGISSATTAYKTSKKLDKELEEQKRHNLEMEKQKRGGGYTLKRQK